MKSLRYVLVVIALGYFSYEEETGTLVIGKEDSKGNFANYPYWTSTEVNQDYAAVRNFGNGDIAWQTKSDRWHVRAVRAF